MFSKSTKMTHILHISHIEMIIYSKSLTETESNCTYLVYLGAHTFKISSIQADPYPVHVLYSNYLNIQKLHQLPNNLCIFHLHKRKCIQNRFCTNLSTPFEYLFFFIKWPSFKFLLHKSTNIPHTLCISNSFKCPYIQNHLYSNWPIVCAYLIYSNAYTLKFSSI